MYKIFEEADRITDEEKRDAYGAVKESFSNLAQIWTLILGDKLDKDIYNHAVALMMIAF